MLITFTQEEQRHIKKIQDSYAPEREHLRLASEAAANKEERAHLLLKQQALYESLQEELEAFSDKCQRIRFERIKTGGTEAIIANAKEQAPMILEQIHRETVRTSEGLTTAALKEMRIGTRKKDTFFVNANYAAAWLKDELRLHIEALVDNKQALQELLEAIIETVEESQYTDNAEITEENEDTPAAVARFRRSPITDITVYGLLNDKATAQIIKDADVFQEAPDGQIRLLFDVNQAGKKEQEEIPLYMSLTFDGADKRLAKKLNGFDNAVYNAVSDLFFYWHRDNPQKPVYITPAEIYRRMNGKQSRDGSAKPSEAQVKRIVQSMDKMRHIDFYMDISAEIKARRITLDDERLVGGRIGDYFVNCSPVEFYTEQGRIVKGYRVNTEPILYTYNAAKKRVIMLPFELLDTSAVLSDSENVTEFKMYLLRRILAMKNGELNSRKILLSSIYKETGVQTPEERATGEYANENSRKTVIRRLKKADRGKIEKLLDAWKGKKEPWIKGYTPLNANGKPVKARQAVHAYEILL